MDIKIPISKIDTSRQLVFGWANISKNSNGESFFDLHGHTIPVAELEKAVYRFNVESRSGGEMHIDTDAPKSVMVESMMFTKEKWSLLGVDGPVTEGWWVGFKVNDPELFTKVKEALNDV